MIPYSARANGRELVSENARWWNVTWRWWLIFFPVCVRAAPIKRYLLLQFVQKSIFEFGTFWNLTISCHDISGELATVTRQFDTRPVDGQVYNAGSIIIVFWNRFCLFLLLCRLIESSTCFLFPGFWKKPGVFCWKLWKELFFCCGIFFHYSAEPPKHPWCHRSVTRDVFWLLQNLLLQCFH